MKYRPTFWQVVFAVIMIIGAYATYVRFFHGLGAVSNMTDTFPWGIWIGFDVLCGVMLAAGGFTVTGAVHILNIKSLQSIVRPTVLTAFLGYVLVCVGLMFDLGRPYNIWHPIIMHNPHSVMFEVGWCVMLYSTVLALEFSPIVLERFGLEKPLKIIHTLLIPLVIFGVILSTLHQSSLGTLYLIMPTKVHHFWYTPAMPFFFFISAIAVGLAMTIFESTLSSRAFGRQLELPVLRQLGSALLVVLWVYGLLRVEDFYRRGELPKIFHPGYEAYFLWLEMALAVILPILLLSQKKVRLSAAGLYWTAVITLLGFVTNRLNVSITGIEWSAGHHYVPKWTEYAITAAIIAAGFFIFAMAVKYLPIFPEEGHEHATPATVKTYPVKVMDEVPETVNA